MLRRGPGAGGYAAAETLAVVRALHGVDGEREEEVLVLGACRIPSARWRNVSVLDLSWEPCMAGQRVRCLATGGPSSWVRSSAASLAAPTFRRTSNKEMMLARRKIWKIMSL